MLITHANVEAKLLAMPIPSVQNLYGQYILRSSRVTWRMPGGGADSLVVTIDRLMAPFPHAPEDNDVPNLAEALAPLLSQTSSTCPRHRSPTYPHAK